MWNARSRPKRTPRETNFTVALAPWACMLALTMWFLQECYTLDPIGAIRVTAVGAYQIVDRPPVHIQLELLSTTVFWPPRNSRTIEDERSLAGQRDLEHVESMLIELRAALGPNLVVMVEAGDSVSYEDYIRVLDLCRGLGFTDLRTST